MADYRITKQIQFDELDVDLYLYRSPAVPNGQRVAMARVGDGNGNFVTFRVSDAPSPGTRQALNIDNLVRFGLGLLGANQI